jgi:hypothetical protein
MITVHNRVGRLVEARFVAPISDDDLARFGQERDQAVHEVRERIVCIDAHSMNVLPPEQSQRLLEVLRRPSPGRLRSAFLLPSLRGVVALQLERLIREAKLEARAFTERRELEAWLGELLTAVEATRLRLFLDESA